MSNIGKAFSQITNALSHLIHFEDKTKPPLTRFFGHAPVSMTNSTEGWLANVLRQMQIPKTSPLVSMPGASPASAMSSAMWPPATHDDLLVRAFPGLTAAERRVLQNGSREVDATYGLVPITLIEKNAYQHAMTPGWKVREFTRQGLPLDEAIQKARQWAFNEAGKWVDGNGEEAKKLQAEYRRTNVSGLSPDALYEFGKGAHTLMDNTSPAHRGKDDRGFAVYSTAEYWNLAKASLPDVAISMFATDMMEHRSDESQQPTKAQIDASNEALRRYFRNVFGEEAYKHAVP